MFYKQVHRIFRGKEAGATIKCWKMMMIWILKWHSVTHLLLALVSNLIRISLKIVLLKRCKGKVKKNYQAFSMSVVSYLTFKLSSDFTISYIQKYGFNTPLHFKDKTGLDIKVPKSDFTVGDVRQCVGNLHLFSM